MQKKSAAYDDLVEIFAVSSPVHFLNVCERDNIVLSPIPTYLEVYIHALSKLLTLLFFF